MLAEFKNYILDHKLFEQKDRVLLAVSGGIDSMVMLWLFNEAGYDFGVAHCNFCLRAEESDADEALVKKRCTELNIPFYSIRFPTASFAESKGISIQMAARDLRYAWFEDLRLKLGYSYIATAHHKGDVIETFFINLARGTGIRGLTGIKNKKNKVIRPLLFLSRREIKACSEKYSIVYRDDASNASVKYARNKIRHEVIPALESIFQGFDGSMLANIERLKEIEEIYINSITEKSNELIQKENNRVVINIKKLRKLRPINAYLYEFLSPYNFNAETIRDVSMKLDGISGKQFFSPTHRLIKDRELLIITELLNDKDSHFSLSAQASELHVYIGRPDELHLNAAEIKRTSTFEIAKSSRIAYLDFEKLEFPLELRKWQQGDSFHPLGMKGKKKISDFFSNMKVSIDKKENTWLLLSGGEIVWVVGYRIDDRFKVSDNSNTIYRIENLDIS